MVSTQNLSLTLLPTMMVMPHSLAGFELNILWFGLPKYPGKQVCITVPGHLPFS